MFQNQMTVKGLAELVEKEIGNLKWKQEPKHLYEPISYILSLGGKRMRPVLVLLGYSLYRQDPEKILKPALAVELFHNFTLMHDDIMDKAPIRRGQPTVHEKWNETVAILSGDTMLVKAYELLSEIEPQYLGQALRLFNTCAVEVCEGQQMDMNFQSTSDVSEAEYLQMIQLKTAVLAGLSLQLGALLAGANEPEQLRLRDFGIATGMAFQLMDDHLDTFGDAAFGKQIGGDILANKKTFLLISSLAHSSAANHVALTKWLETDMGSSEKVRAVTNIYQQEGIEELSKEKIKYFETKALDALEQVSGSDEVKTLLRGYLSKLNQRDS